MSIIGDGIVLGAGGESASIFVTGLSETDTVTATNGSKTKAGVWTQTPNPLAHGLPDEYTELEYIQSSGTQYIKTLQRIHFGDEITLDCQLISASNGQCLYGNTNGSDSSGRIFTYGNRFCAIFGSTWIAGTDTNANTDANRHTIDVSFSSASTSFVIDGVQYGVKSISDPSTDDMALFRWGSQYAQMKCFGYYHKRNGEDLMCAIPCKRNSDGAIGLYDLVSNAFFGNEGTGTFTEGPEIPQTIDGFLISKIKDYGTWNVSNGDGTKTTDVLIDAAADFEVTL